MYLSILDHPWCCHSVRCKVNGIDVTDDCLSANEEEGWAILLRITKASYIPEEIKITGTVVLSLKDDATPTAREEFINLRAASPQTQR